MRIILPDNPKTVQKLERKLAEYDARSQIERQRPFTHFIAPEEVDRAISPHTRAAYKRALLGQVLAEGSIDVDEFRANYKERFGELNEGAFDSAVNVISGYCGDKDARLRGGTGLR